MSVRAQVPYFAAIVVSCGLVWAQNPGASPGQPPTPSTGNPSTPSTNSPGYPGASPMGTETDSTPTFSDKAFVKKAVEQNATEVELSKLAQEKGSSDAVKEFGKRIVEDHTKIAPGLETAAAKVNVDVPTDLPRGGKKAKEKLAKLSGPEFDKAYAKLMLNDQKDSVESFTQEARLGKIPEVKDYAAKALPTIQEHRKMATDLESTVKK